MPRRPATSHRRGSSRDLPNEDVPKSKSQGSSHHPPERAAPQSQDLKFVAVTEQSLQGLHDANEQKSIRSHVMRDFLRQKEAGEGPPQAPSPTAENQAGQMGRFRLTSTSGRKQTKGNSPGRSSPRAGSYCLNREVLPKPPDGGLVSSMLPLLEPANLGRSSPAVEQGANQTIPSLATGRVDPFARFPISDLPGTHQLVDYYRTLFIQNSLAVNPGGKWFTYAATDPAVFHATLSLTAQHRAFATGNAGIEEYYFHRGEAIRLVTERLGNPAEELSDATIGAVALLASSDQNMGGEPNALLYHMNGLEHMVNMRGGITALRDNEPVERVVTWADLSNAAMHDTRPRFPLGLCRIGHDLHQRFSPPFPNSAGPAMMPNYQRPPVPEDMVEIFHDLRLLCLALESPRLIDMNNMTNRRTHSNKLYHIEWVLLSAAPSSPTHTPFGPSLKVGPGASGYVNPPTAESCARSPASNACRHAALTFTYLALRNLPVSAAVFENLIYRLRNALIPLLESDYAALDLRSPYSRTPSGSPGPYPELEEPAPTYSYFSDRSPLPSSSFNLSGPLMLWLLVTGFAACPPSRAEARGWFLGSVLRICGQEGILGAEALTAALKKIVWLDSTCIAVVDDLVREIRGLGRMGW